MTLTSSPWKGCAARCQCEASHHSIASICRAWILPGLTIPSILLIFKKQTTVWSEQKPLGCYKSPWKGTQELRPHTARPEAASLAQGWVESVRNGSEQTPLSSQHAVSSLKITVARFSSPGRLSSLCRKQAGSEPITGGLADNLVTFMISIQFAFQLLAALKDLIMGIEKWLSSWLSVLPSACLGASQLPVAAVPGDLTPSSDFQGHTAYIQITYT